MKQPVTFSYLLRKYPLFRAAILLSVILIAVIILVISTTYFKKTPSITMMSPHTGESGDVLTITGSDFGNIQADSYIELSGERLLASSYLKWTDDEIQFTLPFHSTDGLVYVITSSGRSNPTVFTDKTTLPVSAEEARKAVLPEISSLSVKKAPVGAEIVINGNNFGPIKNTSQVWFSAKTDTYSPDDFISCSEFDSDYIFWSDHEVKVRVPDGAASGTLFISAENGESNKVFFDVTESAGGKTYSDSKTYRIQIAMSATGITANSSASIYIFMPKPAQSAWQRDVKSVSFLHKPVLEDYTGTAVHQISVTSGLTETASLADSYEITVWKTETTNKNQAAKAGAVSAAYCKNWTLPDEAVPSDDQRIKDLMATIVKKETSPWKKTSLIYSWVTSNFQLLHDPRPVYSEIFDSLETGYADAYDEAIIFTSLARAAGIPTLPVAGVLAGADGSCRNHWWAEFYIDDIGWVPADPAMGAGLDFEIETPAENPAAFYFGSLDSSHITISRGSNSIKFSNITARNVSRPRSYAIQSVWEEASSEIKTYTTKWEAVKVTPEI